MFVIEHVFVHVLVQLDELRMSMSRAEQLSARKEDHLRQEVTDTQQVCLSQAVTVHYNNCNTDLLDID